MKITSFASILVLVAACGPSEPGATSASGSQKPPMASATQTGATTAGKPGPTASPAPGDEKKGKMANCPAAAPNAKTEVKDVDKGVEITITAAEKADQDEIKKRAKDLAAKAKGEGDKPQHTGTGGGGGAMGRCPVVVGGTEVKAEDTDAGAKITVTAKDDKEVDWLRRETKERLAAMGDTGEGKMQNCPSAVTGAKTAVKEDAGAIVVTVTATDEAATKDIRARAKKVAEMKHDAAKDPHDASGAGAGEGRCPSVVKDGTATVKEIEGGAEISIKPKDAADLKKLVKEAEDRAARFQ